MTTRDKLIELLTGAYNALGSLLAEIGADTQAHDDDPTGPVTAEMAAAMETAKAHPPGTPIPIGTANVRAGRTERGVGAPSSAPPPPALSQLEEGQPPSPIVGVCNATKGCGTLIAADNVTAAGKLVCPRCRSLQLT